MANPGLTNDLINEYKYSNIQKYLYKLSNIKHNIFIRNLVFDIFCKIHFPLQFPNIILNQNCQSPLFINLLEFQSSITVIDVLWIIYFLHSSTEYFMKITNCWRKNRRKIRKKNLLMRIFLWLHLFTPGRMEYYEKLFSFFFVYAKMFFSFWSSATDFYEFTCFLCGFSRKYLGFFKLIGKPWLDTRFVNELNSYCRFFSNFHW